MADKFYCTLTQDIKNGTLDVTTLSKRGRSILVHTYRDMINVCSVRGCNHCTNCLYSDYCGKLEDYYSDLQLLKDLEK